MHDRNEKDDEKISRMKRYLLIGMFGLLVIGAVVSLVFIISQEFF